MDVFQPPTQIFKRVPTCDVIHKKRAVGTMVIGSGDTLEAFLSRRVPYLDLNRLAFSCLNRSRAKLDTDGHIVRRFEAVLEELKEEGGFAHPRWTHNDVLEPVVVIGGGAESHGCRHFFLGLIGLLVLYSRGARIGLVRGQEEEGEVSVFFEMR